MERLEEPEKALTWVKSIEKVIEKKKDTEERTRHFSLQILTSDFC